MRDEGECYGAKPAMFDFCKQFFQGTGWFAGLFLETPMTLLPSYQTSVYNLNLPNWSLWKDPTVWQDALQSVKGLEEPEWTSSQAIRRKG